MDDGTLLGEVIFFSLWNVALSVHFKWKQRGIWPTSWTRQHVWNGWWSLAKDCYWRHASGRSHHDMVLASPSLLMTKKHRQWRQWCNVSSDAVWVRSFQYNVAFVIHREGSESGTGYRRLWKLYSSMIKTTISTCIQHRYVQYCIDLTHVIASINDSIAEGSSPVNPLIHLENSPGVKLHLSETQVFDAPVFSILVNAIFRR